MKKFKFRLQRVIDVRETREKECQRELSVSMEELRRQQERLKAEEEASQESEKTLRKALGKKVKAGQLRALDGWRSQKIVDLYQQHRRTEEQQGEVEDKRKALVEASKDKKILERLREKRQQEHVKEELREEQAFLDELAGRRKKDLSTPEENNHR